MNEHYPFILEPLPYSYSDLEPYIDTKTVEVHHDRHLKTYVDNLNKALEDLPMYQSWSLERLILQNQMLPRKIQKTVFNNAGGVFNHNFYFQMLNGNAVKLSESPLSKAIDKSFGTFDSFLNEFKQAALDVFGSGYAWLLAEPNGRLNIVTTANQDTALQFRGCKILVIDVWEHAYYLKNLNKRANYIDNIFHLFDWEKAEKLYIDCLRQIS